MRAPSTLRPCWAFGLLTLSIPWMSPPSSSAGDPYRYSRPRRVVETRFAPTVEVQGSEGTLGTFEPTPYVIVRGNGTTGGGYSPMQMYGDQTMVMYGPTSVFRSTTAPVTTYVRGYDGNLQPVSGVSFSNPNLPGLSPVVYPTKSSSYSRSRMDNGVPIRPKDSMNWIDQH